ncbi:MAG: BRCT domain-containing protein [bacterium]|nr:BRCT domain-containing protein [bacterium]MDI1335403.1 BRCT domain-containing protein [Lacunisphaera sp.]
MVQKIKSAIRSPIAQLRLSQMAINIPVDSESAFLLGVCTGLNVEGVKPDAARAFLQLLRNQPALVRNPLLAKHRQKIDKILALPDEMSGANLETIKRSIYGVIASSRGPDYDPVEIMRGLAHLGESSVLTFDELDPKSISISGARFVFSGQFKFGRDKVEVLAIHLGVQIEESTTTQTDYVVVGSIPEPMWKFGNFGYKVERALTFRARKKPIRIITEDLFFTAIPPAAISNESLPITRKDIVIDERPKCNLSGKMINWIGEPSVDPELLDSAVERAGAVFGGRPDIIILATSLDRVSPIGMPPFEVHPQLDFLLRQQRNHVFQAVIVREERFISYLEDNLGCKLDKLTDGDV